MSNLQVILVLAGICALIVLICLAWQDKQNSKPLIVTDKTKLDWEIFKESYLPNLRHQFSTEHPEYFDFREEVVTTLRKHVDSEEGFQLWLSGSENFTKEMNKLTHLTYSRLYDEREVEIQKQIEERFNEYKSED